MPGNAMPARPRRRMGKMKPVDPPMVPFAIGGIVGWAVAGLVLLSRRDVLAAQGREHWLLICLAGFLIGLPGLAIMLRHDAGRRRRRAAAEHDDPR